MIKIRAMLADDKERVQEKNESYKTERSSNNKDEVEGKMV